MLLERIHANAADVNCRSSRALDLAADLNRGLGISESRGSTAASPLSASLTRGRGSRSRANGLTGSLRLPLPPVTISIWAQEPSPVWRVASPFRDTAAVPSPMSCWIALVSMRLPPIQTRRFGILSLSLNAFTRCRQTFVVIEQSDMCSSRGAKSGAALPIQFAMTSTTWSSRRGTHKSSSAPPQCSDGSRLQR